MVYDVCNDECRKKLNEQRDKIRKLEMYKLRLREIRKKQLIDMKRIGMRENTAKHYTTYIYKNAEHGKHNSELRMWTSHYVPEKSRKHIKIIGKAQKSINSM